MTLLRSARHDRAVRRRRTHFEQAVSPVYVNGIRATRTKSETGQQPKLLPCLGGREVEWRQVTEAVWPQLGGGLPVGKRGSAMRGGGRMGHLGYLQLHLVADGAVQLQWVLQLRTGQRNRWR